MLVALTLFPGEGRAQVEMLPNEFRLVFEPLQVEILTGTTETVVLSLTNASRVPAGDEVLVGLSLDDASTVSVVSPTELSFDASATSHEVVLHVAADTSPGATVLVASVETSPASLAGAEFVDAELPVGIIDAREHSRRFQLSLAPAGGQFIQTARPNGAIPDNSGTQSVRSIITVAEDIEIRSLSVRVEIRHQGVRELRVRLVSPQEVEVPLHDRTGGTADGLFRTYTSVDHAGLAALVGARADGPWTLTVGDYIRLNDGILEAWSLEINTFASVLAGGNASLVASLAAVETSRLFAHETLTLALVYDGANVGFSPATLVFSASTTTAAFTLNAAFDARQGSLTAAVADAPENVEVVLAALPVRIVPRLFRLSLSPPGGQFSQTERPNVLIADQIRMQSARSTINVTEDIEIRSLSVRVEIRHQARGDLRVLLVSPEGVEVALHDRTDGTADDIFETYTSVDHAGLAALVGESATGVWELTAGDYVPSTDGDTGGVEPGDQHIRVGVRGRQRIAGGFAGGGRDVARIAAVVCTRNADIGAGLRRHQRRVLSGGDAGV